MPLPDAPLDDRTHDQIVADVKALIPRYAPEWTNQNESDPGVTMLELFASVADMLLYRLNRVPERNYVKFLQLVGIRPEPARPARADLTFTAKAPAGEAVSVPAGAQVAVAGAGPEPLLFETQEAIAVGAELKAVQTYDGISHTDQTPRHEADAQTYPPFGPHAGAGAALLLGFDPDSKLPEGELSLAVFVAPATTGRQSHRCGLDVDALPVPARIAWECRTEDGWTRLRVLADETRAFTRSGYVRLRGPGDDAKGQELGAVPGEHLWIRARVERSAYDRAPELEAVIANTVTAVEGETVRDEVLGGSTARPSQELQLAYPPVLELDDPARPPRPREARIGCPRVARPRVRLEIDEGIGFELWEEVDDFAACGPDDRVFTLDATTGRLVFGNGRHGRIPPANRDRPNDNVVAREYRHGGGRRGNVGAGTITELQSTIVGIESVANRRPATGGTDEEGVEDAKQRAPSVIQAKGRAVTPQDFETLALETPTVRIRRARALALAHPDFPGAKIPGSVTVVVVPDAPGPRPTSGEATLRAVCAHLDLHRLLACEVHVIGPRYRTVRVQTDLLVTPDHDPLAVARQAEATLDRFFHPLVGGRRATSRQDGTGWEFGRDIFASEVARVLLDIDGVARIRDSAVTIVVDGERQPLCRDVPIEDDVLLTSEGHDVTAAYEREP